MVDWHESTDCYLFQEARRKGAGRMLTRDYIPAAVQLGDDLDWERREERQPSDADGLMMEEEQEHQDERNELKRSKVSEALLVLLKSLGSSHASGVIDDRGGINREAYESLSFMKLAIEEDISSAGAERILLFFRSLTGERNSKIQALPKTWRTFVSRAAESDDMDSDVNVCRIPVPEDVDYAPESIDYAFMDVGDTTLPLLTDRSLLKEGEVYFFPQSGTVGKV
jgi:hypothetical protein